MTYEPKLTPHAVLLLIKKYRDVDGKNMYKENWSGTPLYLDAIAHFGTWENAVDVSKKKIRWTVGGTKENIIIATAKSLRNYGIDFQKDSVSKNFKPLAKAIERCFGKFSKFFKKHLDIKVEHMADDRWGRKLSPRDYILIALVSYHLDTPPDVFNPRVHRKQFSSIEAMKKEVGSAWNLNFVTLGIMKILSGERSSGEAVSNWE